MQLVIVILVAVVIGYVLAKSRISKPIDKTSERVTQTTRDLADKTEGWVRDRFGRKQQDIGEPVESEEVEGIDEKKTAAKRSSRRKASEEKEADES
jgi:hypothetical protein